MKNQAIAVVHEDGSVYRVTVTDADGSSTMHLVTVWPSDVERYAPGVATEDLVEASFRFLLARESKESILARFELPVIERYFPDYARVIGSMV